MKITFPFAARLIVAVVLLSGLGRAIAQDAVAADPATLITKTAESLAATNGASTDVRVEIRVVQNEDESSNTNIFYYTKGEGGKFALLTKDEAGQEVPEGITVRSNGAITLTSVGELNKHQLEESNKGIATFVESELASGIANGLGSLVFSMFDVETAAALQSQLTGAEVVGEEEVDDVSLLHARFQVGGQLSFDAWFTQDDNPVVVKVVPDLSHITEPARQQFERFDYTVTFDFNNWDLKKQFEANAFDYQEPEDSTLVPSILEEEKPLSPLLGKEAPLFELKGLDGQTVVNLADHLGKDVVVLDFWATWCPPCVRALPIIDQVTAQFKDKGVVFYALDQEEDADTVANFLANRGIQPPVLLDSESAAANSYGVRGLPTSVIIGKDGTVQVFHVGLSPNLGEKLAAEIEALIEGNDLAAQAVAEAKAREVEQQMMLKLLSDKLKSTNSTN